MAAITLSAPLLLGATGVLSAGPAHAATVCWTAANGSMVCQDDGSGGVAPGAGGVGGGSGGTAPAPAPAAPAPAPAPVPVYTAPAPVPVAPAPAPAPVYNAPAPVQAPVAPAPAPAYNNVPAPVGTNAPAQVTAQAPAQNSTPNEVPVSGVVDANKVETAVVPDTAVAPASTPDETKATADNKAAAEKETADSGNTNNTVPDSAAQDKVTPMDDTTSTQEFIHPVPRAMPSSPTNLPILLVSGGLALASVLTYSAQSFRMRRAESLISPEDAL